MPDALVAVQNGGEVLHVHPTCLAAHEAAGWVETSAPHEPQQAASTFEQPTTKRGPGRPRKYIEPMTEGANGNR